MTVFVLPSNDFNWYGPAPTPFSVEPKGASPDAVGAKEAGLTIIPLLYASRNSICPLGSVNVSLNLSSPIVSIVLIRRAVSATALPALLPAPRCVQNYA